MSNEIRDEIIQGATEIFEAGIDQLLEDGFLKDIPILGTAIRLAFLGKSISDMVLLKKIEKFLHSIPKIGDNERRIFSEKMKNDDKFKSKVGEILLLSLDR